MHVLISVNTGTLQKTTSGGTNESNGDTPSPAVTPAKWGSPTGPFGNLTMKEPSGDIASSLGIVCCPCLYDKVWKYMRNSQFCKNPYHDKVYCRFALSSHCNGPHGMVMLYSDQFYSSCSWNTALKHRSHIRARLLVLFLLSPYLLSCDVLQRMYKLYVVPVHKCIFHVHIWESMHAWQISLHVTAEGGVESIVYLQHHMPHSHAECSQDATIIIHCSPTVICITYYTHLHV